MSVQSMFRWRAGALDALDDCQPGRARVIVADSWLVSDGLTLALELHRRRFLDGIAAPAALDPTVRAALEAEAEAFWYAAIAALPREDDWFPRVEAHSDGSLLFRLRGAPRRSRSAVLASWTGDDPRSTPAVKGPDLEAMLRIRTTVQASGADEAVILSPDGYVAEGAYSGLLWWRGDILCGPPRELERVDSVTARSVLTLARALGFDTHEEAVTAAELEGTELWAVSALHGIRIVTAWIDGPELAERPGRLTTWRSRLDALRRPLP